MKEMGIKKFNELSNLELEKIDKIYVSRETFINKFIEKFPKANLHTLIQINKQYNKKNINNKKNTNKNAINEDNNFSNNFMHDYLLVLN